MRQWHNSHLVSNDKVGVDGGAGPAHDGDEHGEGGWDQIHVQDQRNLRMELMSLEEHVQVRELSIKIGGMDLGRKM